MRSSLLPCLICVALGVAPAAAQDCGDYTLHPEILGQTEILSGSLPASLRAVAASPPYAFAASSGELHVVDISTPAAPAKVATAALPAPARNLTRMILRGDFLYATDPNYSSGGFRIVDVSAPTAPSIRGSLESNAVNYGEFALVGSYAFVQGARSTAQGSEYFVHVVSVVSPDFPLIRDEVPIPNYASILAANESLMLAGNYLGEISSFDVSDPLAVTFVSSIQLGAGVSSIVLHNDLAFVNTEDARLFVLDVTDPSSMSVLVTLDGLAFGRGQMTLHGDRLYGTGYGAWALDISAPGSPSLLGNMSGSTMAYAVSTAPVGDLLVLATSDGEFMIADWSNPVSVLPSAPVPGLAGAQDLALSGQIGYLLAGNSLIVLSLTEPHAPVQLGAVELPETGSRLLVENELAFVVTHPDPDPYSYPLNLTVCDISDPNAPSVLGSTAVTSSGRVHDIARWGSHLYVTTFETGNGLAYLRVFDVADPQLPTLENSIYLNFYVGFEGSVWRGPRMDVEKGTLYLSFYNGFDMFDLADPINPGLIHRAQFPWHRSSDLQVVDDRVFVSFHTQDEWYNPPPPPDVERTRGLHVVDISTPTSPAVLGVHETVASPRDLVVDGSHAYLIVDGRGIEMIDVRDPAAPQGDGYWLTFEQGQVRVVREMLYGLFEEAPYLQAAPLPCGAEAVTGLPPEAVPLRRLVVRPNPFNPRTEIWTEIEVDGFARVQVFDTRGRLVRTIHEGLLTRGEHRFRWDGTDLRGRKVASGAYRVLLSGDVPPASAAAVLVH